MSDEDVRRPAPRRCCRPGPQSAGSCCRTRCPPGCSSSPFGPGSRTCSPPRSNRPSCSTRSPGWRRRSPACRYRRRTPIEVTTLREPRVITVFSTKGGAGKSVIATNLAVSLARRTDRPVVLVDADLQFGDVAVMLKLAPAAHHRRRRRAPRPARRRRSSQSLLVAPRAVRPAGAARRRSSRPSPTRSAPTRWSQIIELLRTFCGYVVIDTPAYFNDVVLGLIEESRRRPAGRRHGHPEHQEREDRPADPAAAQHADEQAPPGPQPGQLEGEARRRRGRAHAAGEGRVR